MQVALYNISGDKIGDVELSDAIFGQEVNACVMHEVVKNYLANQRQGTQSTKTRTEVSGGGIKPWRQKGTGVQDRAAFVHLSGQAAELHSDRNPEVTDIHLIRK